jgi:hypothetical protein
VSPVSDKAKRLFSSSDANAATTFSRSSGVSLKNPGILDDFIILSPWID